MILVAKKKHSTRRSTIFSAASTHGCFFKAIIILAQRHWIQLFPLISPPCNASVFASTALTRNPSATIPKEEKETTCFSIVYYLQVLTLRFLLYNYLVILSLSLFCAFIHAVLLTISLTFISLVDFRFFFLFRYRSTSFFLFSWCCCLLVVAVKGCCGKKKH